MAFQTYQQSVSSILEHNSSSAFRSWVPAREKYTTATTLHGSLFLTVSVYSEMCVLNIFNIHGEL